ncbi:Rpn family recombination-promoting nuclease/putative transposase [Paenibacillus doosanensis]|uniref:Rpn family recombination-promoting nuclease/putative transposase n=1 Tax=Paenibacillus doosanensis TaxID=1229154 RepID=UPI00218012DC|nr:Rpn family recombination-promoting nuclease/putative transposase [Paenibacillus doosanensis]MCS7464992.1 Rpn family recombination-promoting nuclease/putative transposase [Paenibacillus doosanensis]
MSDRLLDPRNDFVFKRIFGSEDNKDILLAFLNRTFMETNEPPLTEIILMNPYTEKDAPSDKQSILDIKARTIDGKLVNIEIQLFNRYDIEKRTLYYWSKMYSDQLAEGQTYRELKKCITINILDFSYLPDKQYHSVFRLREQRTGLQLTDDLEIHFMELPKLDDTNVLVEGGLVNWLLFLKGVDQSTWEVLTMNEPMLKKAMTTLKFLSQDAEARQLYEARQKYLHDEASMIEGAKAEGERKKALEIAKSLLDSNVDIAVIAKSTGLSMDEIEKLRTH